MSTGRYETRSPRQVKEQRSWKVNFHILNNLIQILGTRDAMKPDLMTIESSAVGPTEAPAEGTAKNHVDKEKDVPLVDYLPQSDERGSLSHPRKTIRT